MMRHSQLAAAQQVATANRPLAAEWVLSKLVLNLDTAGTNSCMASLREVRDRALAVDDATFLSQVTIPVLLVDAVEPFGDGVKFDTMHGAAPKTGAAFLPKRVNLDQAQIFELKKGGTNPFSEHIFIGRTKTNDIMLRHESVSKSHAFFKHSSGVWSITDNNSKNGTFVSGVQVAPSQEHPLKNRASIVLGSSVAFFLEPEGLLAFCRSVTPG